MDNFDNARRIRNAAAQGDLAEVQRLVGAGTDLDAKDEYNETPLMAAVSRGHAAVADWLLVNGADPNARRTNNESALLYAVWDRHLDLTKLLIEAGADVNSRCRGKPLLIFSCINNAHARTAEQTALDMNICQALLEAGANPNEAEESDGMTFLMFCHDARVLSFAIDKGAEINALSSGGSPVLHYHLESPETLQLLINRGADIESRNRHGFTPLMSAVARGLKQTVEILLASGANTGAAAKGPFGEATTVHFLAREYPEVAKLIKKSSLGFLGRLFRG